jgi:hypothetical protein
MLETTQPTPFAVVDSTERSSTEGLTLRYDYDLRSSGG